jgi:bla regulator protein BlaR1
MISYLIKSACCAVIFLLLYRCILEKEKMHRFNRIYLLVSVVLSLIIPFINLPISGEVLPSVNLAVPVVFAETDMQQTTLENAVSPVTEASVLFSPQTWLWILYGTVTGILLVRFGINLYRLAFACRNKQFIYHENVRLVIIHENISSSTFLNTVFLSQDDYNSFSSEILRHEFAHVKQKHSIDILFIEIIKIIFWFNPVFILYKRSIQLNHEFLADEAVIKQCANVTAYQHLLLDRISLASPTLLGSRFNYSVTKKRLQMMTQKTSSAKALLKQFFIVPLLIICVTMFGTRSALSKSGTDAIVIVQDTTAKAKTGESVRAPGVMPFLRDMPYTQTGITEEEMAEYRQIQGKYLDKNKTSRDNYVLFSKLKDNDADRKKLQALFLQMTRKQQQSVNIVLMKHLAPRKKNPPTQEQVERWKNPALYGVWIDEKKVSNDVLNNYTASDFSLYNASNLHGAAKKNVKYQVQVNIMTNRYHADYYKKEILQIKDDPYAFGVFWMERVND